ncbi:hypothetical protein [Metabacillus sp. RGM 3146]|uniref:hypothetical protein n=1 Tax=Metabacillus sp. RGM 3146 TaxID=3401092 RepID=UPI003B99E542
MKKFFVTGFPGFIARELIREANKQELFSHVYVLSLPHLVPQARELLSEIAPGKGTVLEGDITKR